MNTVVVELVISLCPHAGVRWFDPRCRFVLFGQKTQKTGSLYARLDVSPREVHIFACMRAFGQKATRHSFLCSFFTFCLVPVMHAGPCVGGSTL